MGIANIATSIKSSRTVVSYTVDCDIRDHTQSSTWRNTSYHAYP